MLCVLVFLICIAAFEPLPNVALGKQTIQSSTWYGPVFGPSKGVDGCRNGNLNSGCCTHNDEDLGPWWRVDLLAVYKVSAVTIINRQDGYIPRILGVQILIGNSLEQNGNQNPRCAVISHISKGQAFYFPCNSMKGRYVTVFLPGSAKVLSLCEVEVYYGYPLPNVALKREATQSSTLSVATASKAIDGRRNSFYSNGFCSHTAKDETNPWWRVDLQRSFTITAVKVTNRGDCCAERLDGAEIRIGNSLENNGNNNPRCASISHIKAGKTYTYQCDGGSMEGRFVNVFLPGQKKTLTLCEVEVYAAPAVPDVIIAPTTPPPPPTPPPPVSLQLGGRNVTVVGERLCWSDALMYCRRYYWDLLSLHSQQEQSELEQLLGLIPFPLTDHVWLGLRRSLRGDEWFWMSGQSMDFLNWPQGFVPDSYSSTCGGMTSREHLLWQDQPCEENLNFICQSGAQDSVQRVDFDSTAIATRSQ
ncbi:hypothetical protein ACER0C_001062 [Sarotherodon galilaeus]